MGSHLPGCGVALWLLMGLLACESPGRGAKPHISEEPNTVSRNTSNGEEEPLVVLGGVEWVQILAEDGSARIRLEGRMDTGARTSSLHAVDLKRLEHGGEPWVRFSTGDDASRVTMEAPRIRKAEVHTASVEEPDRRPVVMLQLQVGTITREVEVNLTDRTHMTFPVLVGRNFLDGVAVIDVSRNHTQGPDNQGGASRPKR